MWMRYVIGAVCALWMCGAVAAATGERVALVVGNAAYAQIGTLDNPGNDAGLIGDVLEAAGFEVTLLFDATQAELNAAVVAFGRTLREKGPDTVGLFYFAGHGVQSRGKNFLLPVDAALADAADLDLVGVEADVILRQMGSARNKTNIVILDSCRNNPFAALEGLTEPGLAEMKAAPGTFVSYATGPGDVALDGLGQHSPFSAALADAMRTPGAAIESVFKQVRVRVVEETRGIQTPWDTSLLTTDFVFFSDEVVAAADAEEASLWAEVETSRNPVSFTRFLRSHPDGRFAAVAGAKLQALLGDSSQSDTGLTRALSPVSVTPQALDTELYETARVSGNLADYETYLETFPTGVYAELVQLEIAGLRLAGQQ